MVFQVTAMLTLQGVPLPNSPVVHKETSPVDDLPLVFTLREPTNDNPVKKSKHVAPQQEHVKNVG